MNKWADSKSARMTPAASCDRFYIFCHMKTLSILLGCAGTALCHAEADVSRACQLTYYTTSASGWTVASQSGDTLLSSLGTGAKVTTSTTAGAGAYGVGGAGTVWSAGLPTGAASSITEPLGSLYARGGNITLSFTGLENGFYDLSCLMARGNNNIAGMAVSVTSAGREWADASSFAVNMGTAGSTAGTWTGMSTGTPTFAGTTNAGALYMDLSRIQVTDGSLTLTIRGTVNGTANNTALSWLSLKQVQVPEPASTLLACGGFLVWGVRRRRS